MSTSDNHTPDPLAGGAQLTPADGGGAVDQTALSLSELNQYLGKDFKDVDTAKKALKDTFSYVGKRKDDIEREVRASLSGTPPPSDLESQVRSLSNQLFYTQNPQYKGYEALIARMGTSPAEVTNSEEFKNVFEKAKVADEVAQKKSVVSSSPRLAQTTTYMQEAVQMANATGSTEQTADLLAKALVGELES